MSDNLRGEKIHIDMVIFCQLEQTKITEEKETPFEALPQSELSVCTAVVAVFV